MKKLPAYLSISLSVLLFLVYWWRPCWAAALAIFPAWMWLVLWPLALPVVRSSLFVVVSISWLIFGLFQVEEWQSVLRTFLPKEEHHGGLRVTTINCSGSIESLKDAFTEQPDIILVQESPGRLQIENWLKEKPGYAFLYGFDTSIIARGTLSESGDTMFYKAGTAEIDERTFFIVSLRLLTSSPRIDLWSPDCWRAQCQTRERQLEQMTQIAEILPSDAILILGGDFNVPQRDKVFSAIRDKTADTFKTGGRGWCNTILVDYPMLRIDQIWTSPALVCVDAYARKCRKTDHKLYTAELKFDRRNQVAGE